MASEAAKVGTPPAPKPGPGQPGSGPPVRAVEAAPAPRRTKKRKAPDRQIPDKVAHVIPESELFNKLLDYERRVDAIIRRKKSDIFEALHQPEHKKQRLRVYVFNTHRNQGAQPPAADGSQSAPEPPSWTLYVYGRVVDPGDSSTTPQSEPRASKSQPPEQQFSSLLNSFSVTLDATKCSGGPAEVTWERAKHTRDHVDTFVVSRVGSQPLDVTINLDVDHQPTRYKLPVGLAQVLNIQYETRASVLQALWAYIKAHKLQDPRDPVTVILDDSLRFVFGGKAKIAITDVSAHLTSLLTPVPPVSLTYRIRVDGKSPSPPEVYDIELEVAAPPKSTDVQPPFYAKYNRDAEIAASDTKLSAAIGKINEHRRRRAFFLAFSQSPADFINALVTSQALDLRIAKASAAGREYAVLQRSDAFREKWVEDALMKYLQRKQQAGH